MESIWTGKIRFLGVHHIDADCFLLSLLIICWKQRGAIFLYLFFLRNLTLQMIKASEDEKFEGMQFNTSKEKADARNNLTNRIC